MQSRDCLWESHVKSDGPGSCVPLWQQMLLPAPMNALGSFPVLQKASWDHSPFCREQVGTKKFHLSTPRLLLCALSPLRPRSRSYLRTQIPFKKMSISKPHWYRNSFENMNSKGLKNPLTQSMPTPFCRCKTSHKIQINFMCLGTAILRGKEPADVLVFF